MWSLEMKCGAVSLCWELILEYALTRRRGQLPLICFLLDFCFYSACSLCLVLLYQVGDLRLLNGTWASPRS